MTPAVETHDLTKHFGAVRAVDGIDLAVRTGEVFGFLGPNGAGKTTTIRMLLDFVRPTSGHATVLGGSGGDPAVRARVGYLPGDLHVDPRWTANDLLEHFGRLRGRGDRRHFDALCARFALDPARPFGELSTGNRRKVGIVQAFAHRPELLVLDEPTSGLDPLLQHEFELLVREAAGDGATVFLSSHVLPEVEALADRIAIVRAGRLVTVSTIDELRARARQRIDFHLDAPAPDGAFAGVPEVRSVEHRDHCVSVVVEGRVDGVLRAAAALPVVRIVSRDDDLEDIFLAYYRDAAPEPRP